VKNKVRIFIAVTLLALLLVPAINLIERRITPPSDGKDWWTKSVLLNYDLALSVLGRILYPLGISTDPAQAIIGKSGWLFLGDAHGRTISLRRSGAGLQEVKDIEKIGAATLAWQAWFKHQGVSQYRIMLGPDKETIYSEFLPDWAQPAATSVTDMLLTHTGAGIYIDTRAALRAAKGEFPEALYYQNNTHWNSLGAWVAFRAFSQQFAPSEPGLRWLAENQVRISRIYQDPGGDLARFLRLQNVLSDQEVSVEISGEPAIETEQYDFETGRLLASDGNPRIGAPQRPLLVKSKNALNQNRVLWLRDSFGVAMSPFMAASFAQTLQLHYSAANPVLLAQLVERFKPDYVFVTVVERDSRLVWFQTLPPN
jgi:hypothetical protein